MGNFSEQVWGFSVERHQLYFEVTTLGHPGVPGMEFIPAVLDRPADIGQLDRLASFPTLDKDAQVQLIRAASAYASGLWWANEDPNQAWLQFVTAIETAAGRRQTITAGPTELIEDLWPDLWKSLEQTKEAVREDICTLLANQVKATKKFITFLTECAPAPPEIRPEFGKLDWSKMQDHARLIYGHRSKALHTGKPFPLPMLALPHPHGSGAQEVPPGLNAGGQGGIWDARETPMLLWTFEHIARGALLKWWDELARDAVPGVE